MDLNNIHKVEIGDLVFYLRYSNRAFLTYLNASTKDPDDYEPLIRYYYDLSRAGARAEGVEFTHTFETFADAIDPHPDAIQKMNEAISKMFGEDVKKKVQK